MEEMIKYSTGGDGGGEVGSGRGLKCVPRDVKSVQTPRRTEIAVAFHLE